MTTYYEYEHIGPIPIQGSVRAMRIANRAVVVQGGSATGRDVLAGFRADMAEDARRKGTNQHHKGPVSVNIEAYIARPKSHYGTGRNKNTLKPNAPTYPNTPDLDKIQRAVGDALQAAGVINDDSQIRRWEAGKYYGRLTGLTIIVYAES